MSSWELTGRIQTQFAVGLTYMPLTSNVGCFDITIDVTGDGHSAGYLLFVYLFRK